MKDFIKHANTFDKREQLLEEWIVRKEQEIKSRVMLPTKSMQKTDSELHQEIDSKLKKARESLVSKFLVNDEFGNPAA